jgi:hypothetical protein
MQPREHHSSQHNCSRSSGHSLHSITSSEMSTGAGSVVSCSTSLSTDTLYWDPNVQHRPPPCLQYAKPKSWDNLTTKAFGGYGFGYGYLDTTKTTHSAERPTKSGKIATHLYLNAIRLIDYKTLSTLLFICCYKNVSFKHYET